MQHILKAALMLAGAYCAAAEPVSAHLIPNHHGWGWDGYVLSNGLVTVGLIPAIGGRVMQYDLGAHPFLWVNVTEVGKTYDPTADEPAHDFGGYRTIIAPERSWRRGLVPGPPAPHLDYGAYATSIDAHDERSPEIISDSPIETLTGWQACGLRFQRRISLTRASTRVHIEQKVTNTTTRPMVLSIWDDTRVAAAHEAANDYERFWIYFPISHVSAFGPRGFMAYAGFPAGYSSAQWRAASDEGWGSVQYLHQNGRIGIDATNGWMCCVDERDGYAYAKRFSAGVHDTYADPGITMAVGTSDQSASMSMNVFSPLVDLAGKSSYVFSEDWFSARIDGPVVAVTDVGIIKRHLTATASQNGKNIHFSGVFGIFYEGSLALTAIDASGMRSGLESYYVSPIQPLVLDVDIPTPIHEQTKLVLEMLDADGVSAGILDSVAAPAVHASPEP